MVRSAVAVLAGFLLMNLISGLFALGAMRLFPGSFDGVTAVAAAGSGWAFVSLVYSALAALSGGFATAYVAGEQATRSVLALLFSVVGLGVFSLFLSDGTLPLWYLLALLALTIPAILFGGWLRGAKTEG